MLNQRERNYATSERELLALTWAIKIYRCYLLGRSFNIFTDHQPLKRMLKARGTTRQMLCLQQKLSKYDYELLYCPGLLVGNADALSRAIQ